MEDFLIFSSIRAPHIICAFGFILFAVSDTTYSASFNVISSPPTTFIKARVELLTSASKSGELSAVSTATRARSSCFASIDASPNPITPKPASINIVLRSAKSTLTKPDFVTNSAMPLTLLASTSSHTLNAVLSGRSGTRLSKRSFFITIKVSVCFFNFSKPASAFSILTFPSDANGNVTTATVKAPFAFACSAMTGALPVPVPPPIPHVINTNDAPASASFISVALSFAASSPICGLLPAPRPPVNFFPIINFLFDLTLNKCFASVFMPTS